jgi:hypothetical protein
MNQKNEEKLRLGKITIQDLEVYRLNRDQLKTANGGSTDMQLQITIIRVFC